MEKNINNTKANETVISNRTRAMLDIMREFARLQERIVPLFEDEVDGENVIEATADVYHIMQETVTAHICETMTESRMAEI